MTCPNCLKELPEGSVFCGFCGLRIIQPIASEGMEPISEKPAGDVESKAGQKQDAIKSWKKGRIAVRIILLVLLMSAGAVLGYFTAVYETRIREFFSDNKIVWTQSDYYTE